jgi:hypothetical protein
MTVDQLIALASQYSDVDDGCQPEHASSVLGKLARGILDLLSTEATRCGFDEPKMCPGAGHDGPAVFIPEMYGGAYVESDRDARWLATAILRACDEADAMGEERK